MKWNLRMTAAHRGIWKASELQRMLADAGLVISAGKMSGLWSGCPASVKLDELDVICAVLSCGIDELLVPEPRATTTSTTSTEGEPEARAASAPGRSTASPVTPRRRDGRSLPPA